MLHSDALIRGVIVLRELDHDVPMILGDRIQLQQVVLNLLLNAFDAMREGLSRDRIVIVRSRRVDADVLVTVSDRGPGIPPEDMDRLFEPFRSTKPGGLGMGLSISRSIVASHGGTHVGRDGCLDKAQPSVLHYPSMSTRRHRCAHHERTHTDRVRGGRRRLGPQEPGAALEVDGISRPTLRLGERVPGRLAPRPCAGLPGARCPVARFERAGAARAAPRSGRSRSPLSSSPATAISR